MVSLLRRRAMMVQAAAPSVEPNYTITDFTGNGTTSVTIDLGITDPEILIIYPKTPLTGGVFPNNNGGQRLMQLADGDYERDLIANTRSNTSSGGYLGTASGALLTYQNGVLSYGTSSTVLRNGYAYRCLAVKQASNNVSITDITGNGQTSIPVDLGIDNPSIIILYATTPMESGSFPNQSDGPFLFELYDSSVSQSRMLFAYTRASTSNGHYFYVGTNYLEYSNGILTVGNTRALRNNYPYRVIAIA